MAPASNLRTGLGFLSPSGVKYFRTDSYVMKFSPTFELVSRNTKDGATSSQTHVWGNTGDCRDDATIKSDDATLISVHQSHGAKHARQPFTNALFFQEQRMMLIGWKVECERYQAGR